MSLNVDFTAKFKKDLKLAKKQHKNINLLLQIINKLANEENLETKYNDHLLIGNYANNRELHIEPDLLLIYEIDYDDSKVILKRLGSHSNLFK